MLFVRLMRQLYVGFFSLFVHIGLSISWSRFTLSSWGVWKDKNGAGGVLLTHTRATSAIRRLAFAYRARDRSEQRLPSQQKVQRATLTRFCRFRRINESTEIIEGMGGSWLNASLLSGNLCRKFALLIGFRWRELGSVPLCREAQICRRNSASYRAFLSSHVTLAPLYFGRLSRAV